MVIDSHSENTRSRVNYENKYNKELVALFERLKITSPVSDTSNVNAETAELSKSNINVLDTLKNIKNKKSWWLK